MSLSTRSEPRPGDPSPGRRRPAPTACFSVQAVADPSVLLRVLELFAKRGLVPARCVSARDEAAGQEMHIDIQVDGMAAETVGHVARALRQIVYVETVLTSQKQLP